MGFVLREDGRGNRFYDHELTEIINPDWLVPGRDASEEALGHRTNRGYVMNMLRERPGINDGMGQVLFQAREGGAPSCVRRGKRLSCRTPGTPDCAKRQRLPQRGESGREGRDDIRAALRTMRRCGALPV